MSSAPLAFACELADAARKVTLANFRRPLQITAKADASPVTIADREAEMTMRELIRAKRPQDAVLGEEFGREEGKEAGGDVWVLDPIDGTKSFISGSPLYCTLIAFAREGKAEAGVIDMPALNERWQGVCDGQENYATFNGEPCKTSEVKKLSEARITTTTIGWQDGADDNKLSELCRQSAHARLGGDAFCYGCVASGFADIAADYAMRVHDYLPLVPIITAAGGIITDWQGKELTLPQTDTAIGVIAAATPELHKEALAALS